MPFSTIDKSSNYFRIKTYTGDGTSGRSITFDETTNMQPDFVWYKSRSNAYNHGLFDSVRGTTKFLISNTTDSESTLSGVTSFNSNGFTVGSDAGSNGNGATFCSWSWKANGAGVSNNSGSITSTVSANTTSGFSICTFTSPASGGYTFGHGLGVAPSMYIVKQRNGATNWLVYHKSIGATNLLRLNLTDASVSSTAFNNTSPTTTVASLNASVQTGDFVSLCFAEVKGFSKFSSYTGNGSTDGTFVYTGMRPAFLMLKRTDTTGSWQMYDNKRDTYNPEISRLGANLSSEESTSASIYIDFLSNGFKMRNSTADWNASGGTYIYMCFAEQPFTSSKGIVANAR